MFAKLLSLIGIKTGNIRNIRNLAFSSKWGWAGILLASAAFLPFIWFLTKRFEGKPVSPKKQKILMSIRLLWAAGLIFLCSSPGIVVSGYVPKQNKVAVILDVSKSMEIKVDDETRMQRVEKIFKKGLLDKVLKKTGSPAEVFAFSDTVSPISRHEIENFSINASGNYTNLGDAVKNVTSYLGETNMLGAIIITDGANNAGENPLIALRNTRVPLYPIAPGTDGDISDLGIKIPGKPSIGFLNSAMAINGEITARNPNTSEVEITVKKDGQIHDNIKIALNKEGLTTPFAYNLACEEEGLFRYEFSLPVSANELTTENNKTGFMLKVVKERINVLAIAGKPSWDLKFILHALSSDPNTDMTMYIKAGEKWVHSKSFKPQKAIQMPDFAKEIEAADAIILQELSYENLRQFQDALVTKIESGKAGLLLLPSGSTVYHPAYSSTPFAKLLPVNLAGSKWHSISGNMKLPPGDPEYSFLKLQADRFKNEALFSSAPKFNGIFEFSEIKPAAQILISSTVRGKNSELPFLLHSRAGMGNVLMFTGGPVWPMGFRTVPVSGSIKEYTAFIVNMAKWLANRKEDAQVSIEIPGGKAFISKPAKINVWVMDSANKLLSSAQVHLKITEPEGTETKIVCRETSQTGCYEASFTAVAEGTHKIEASAYHKGAFLGTSTTELYVEMPTAEFENPQIDHELLSKLAEQSGGYFAYDVNFSDIFDKMEVTAATKLETAYTDFTDLWFLFLWMALLPIAEWYLRRTGGLS